MADLKEVKERQPVLAPIAKLNSALLRGLTVVVFHSSPRVWIATPVGYWTRGGSRYWT